MSPKVIKYYIFNDDDFEKVIKCYTIIKEKCYLLASADVKEKILIFRKRQKNYMNLKSKT